MSSKGVRRDALPRLRRADGGSASPGILETTRNFFSDAHENRLASPKGDAATLSRRTTAHKARMPGTPRDISVLIRRVIASWSVVTRAYRSFDGRSRHGERE